MLLPKFEAAQIRDNTINSAAEGCPHWINSIELSDVHVILETKPPLVCHRSNTPRIGYPSIMHVILLRCS